MHPIITRFGRWRQETCRFEDSLFTTIKTVSQYTHTHKMGMVVQAQQRSSEKTKQIGHPVNSRSFCRDI